MRGGTFATWLLIVSCCCTCICHAQPASSPTTVPAADPIQTLVDDLCSPDYATREASITKLAKVGAPVRPILLDLMHNGSPEAAARSWEALRQISFAAPDDPPLVRAMLQNYGADEEEQRQRRIELLIRMGELSRPALARLVFEEPSTAIRWTIVAQFDQAENSAVLAQLRARTPDPTDAPQLVLAGWAWRPMDVQKSVVLLRLALDADAKQPSEDAGELMRVMDFLLTIYLWDQKYDQAAAIYRMQYERDPGSSQKDGLPINHLDDLFALHARYGPFSGFGHDLLTAMPQFPRPQILFALSKVLERNQLRPLASVLARAVRIYSNHSLTRSARWELCEFLWQSQWYDLAEKQMLDLVAEGKGDSEHGLSLLWLADLDFRRDDDLACAKRIDDGIELIAILPIGFGRWRIGGGSTRLNGMEAIDYTRAEAQWHYLRAAHTLHDAGMARKHGEKLAALAPDDADIVADAASILLEFGMRDEVDKLFARPYLSLQGWLDANRTDPARMNALAWLCARCQKNLPRALELATAATQQRPNDAQFLDTLAEVHFAMGHRDEAVRIETRALELAPNQAFYRTQLDRFRSRSDSAG